MLNEELRTEVLFYTYTDIFVHNSLKVTIAGTLSIT